MFPTKGIVFKNVMNSGKFLVIIQFKTNKIRTNNPQDDEVNSPVKAQTVKSTDA